MTLDPRAPVIVGVGQVLRRDESGDPECENDACAAIGEHVPTACRLTPPQTD